MYAAAMDDLASAGYEQYEISNFAQPGYRCRTMRFIGEGLRFSGSAPARPATLPAGAT